MSITQTVADILANVKANGDTALLEYNSKFDNNTTSLQVTTDEIETAYKTVSDDIISALELAATRIADYHQKIMPTDVNYTDGIGVKLGNRWVPMQRAGLYVPGGKACYPSSVLMNAIPAKVAGVKEVVAVTPAINGKVEPIVLAACKIAGISKIYKVGGAQGIAALTYGTNTVPAVDVIVGPGNAYVAEAKRQVYGIVGIDMIAGPSEILVIADEDNNPSWLAADLLSQAEHDEDARCYFVTTSKNLADALKQELTSVLSSLERKDIAAKSIDNNFIIKVVDNLDEATEYSNKIAPEHLELCVANPNALLAKITNAGAVFLGKYTPEAIGDYTAGPSHVLPTSGTARFSSGLSVYDFLRRQSIIQCDKTSFDKLAPATKALAEEEGLTAHALSVKVRT